MWDLYSLIRWFGIWVNNLRIRTELKRFLSWICFLNTINSFIGLSVINKGLRMYKVEKYQNPWVFFFLLMILVTSFFFQWSSLFNGKFRIWWTISVIHEHFSKKWWYVSRQGVYWVSFPLSSFSLSPPHPSQGPPRLKWW